MNRKRFAGRAIQMVAAGAALAAAGVLSSEGVAAQQPPAGGPLHTLHVQGNVYMIVGDGGNVTVQVGDNGVLLVDSGTAAQAPALIDEVKKIIGSKPIRWILNTTFDEDHTGGNVALKKVGQQIVAGNFAGQVGAGEGAAIVARQEVLDWMSEPLPTPPAATGAAANPGTVAPSDAWPTESYTEPHDDFFFDGEAVVAFHAPAAHTGGDSLVFFRRSDVLSTGDVFIETTFPVIDLKHGGTINGLLDGLNQIIDIAVPDHQEEGGTLIVPGHGRLCDEADVVDYRDMVTIIRDRVQDMIKKGMTVEQVVAAGPAQDYAQRYGATSGPWTTTQFVQAIYQTLKPAATPAKQAAPASKGKR